jgi:hypothetical protein
VQARSLFEDLSLIYVSDVVFYVILSMDML